MPTTADRYPGEELDLFSRATRWKAYWAAAVQPYLGHEVLEVGAGIGANTALLAPGHVGRWVCLEPDPALAHRIPAALCGVEPVPAVEVRTGRVQDLVSGETFDTALYVDVLEHIEDDAGELAAVAGHIRSGGTVVVLAPAFQVLYSPFDRAVGHYRRYNRHSLQRAVPSDLEPVRMGYLDVLGVAASLANRLLLRQSIPAAAQVRFWDQVLVPVSSRLDGLIGHCVGRSILGVWRVP